MKRLSAQNILRTRHPQEAETLLRRSLAIKKKTLGTHHPSYAASLHTLAHVLDSQGNYKEAERLLRRALALVKKALGTHHPSYAASLNALACVLASQGNYEEAARLLRRSIVLDEKAMGTDHPTTGPMLTNLGYVLAAQGRAREGLPFVEQALRMAVAAHGTEHPEVAETLCELARLQAITDHPDAAATARRALETLTATLGPQHPRVEAARPLLLAISDRASEAEASNNATSDTAHGG